MAHISDQPVNVLRLVIEEAVASPEAHEMEINGVVITGLHSVKHQPESRTFEVVWPSYIAYSVTNESYTGGSEGELFEGRQFVLYSKSHYLDFVQKATFATSEYPGPFKHWGIFCADHIVDVVSVDEPVINLVPAS